MRFMMRLRVHPGLTAAGAAFLALLAAAIILGAPVAEAAPPAVTPSTGTAIEAPDYASQYWSDPWDYSNGEDLSLIPNVNSANVANLAMAGGNLAFDSLPGYIEPVWASGAFAHGRDADIHPVNAGAYTRLSFRMYSGAASDQAGAILWFSCVGAPQSCQGAMSFLVRPGWNTYDLQLSNTLGGIPWSGAIRVMRIIPSNFANHYEIDWMRLYQPIAGNMTLTVSGGNADEVWYDADSDPNNNDPSQLGGKSAGRLAGYTPNGGTVTFSTQSMPPGEYRFYTKQGGQVSPYSAPLVINASPEPVVIDPDIKGGEDYATVVRGDSWDFSQVSDVWSIVNTAWWMSDGALRGTYGGPSPNDPQVVLPLAGSIDASLFHRLTYRVYYDGPFGLEDAPGGGMVARVIWTIYQGGVPGYHDSQDMIVFPGWQDISVDLKTDPPSLAEDESSTNRIGWGGPLSRWVSAFRFDPHEDPGGRTWFLDEVALRRDDRGTPNFNIMFQDNAWESGTTAEIWADADAGGFDGFLLAGGVPVDPGVNTFNWNGSGIPDWGIWWIHVKLTDPGGSVGRAYSTGPVEMSPPPDGVPPGLAYAGPSGSIANGAPAITATVNDPVPSSGINAGSARLQLNGGLEQPCSVAGATVTCLTSGLENGHYEALISIADNAGNTGTSSGSFDVTGQSYLTYDSYFTWYDSIGAYNWVLMANPFKSQSDITFSLAIAGTARAIDPLPGLAPGQANPGNSIYAIYPGVKGGPVEVSYKAAGGSSDRALVSQRTLWAGSSLEEVLATESAKMSNHFLWTWYDDVTPGYSNYVMIANPGPGTVYFRIRVGGSDQGPGSFGSIAPGQTGYWRGDDVMGGPVEVEAWSDGVDGGVPANVLASQRVLSNYGLAFNELPGITAGELSSHYLWTWYDSIGSFGNNWIVVANPGSSPSGIYYRIKIRESEEVQCGGPVAPNGYDYFRKDGLRDGPVELTTYSDHNCTVPAQSIASQRVIWGPSFGEVPGYRHEALAPEYHWTWYDMSSPGAQNWVMVANPTAESVTYSIRIGADTTPVEAIAPGQRVYRTFNGVMGGPVQVTASGNVMVSQRVLWNGHFNETLGTVLD